MDKNQTTAATIYKLAGIIRRPVVQLPYGHSIYRDHIAESDPFTSREIQTLQAQGFIGAAANNGFNSYTWPLTKNAAALHSPSETLALICTHRTAAEAAAAYRQGEAAGDDAEGIRMEYDTDYCAGAYYARRSDDPHATA